MNLVCFNLGLPCGATLLSPAQHTQAVAIPLWALLINLAHFSAGPAPNFKKCAGYGSLGLLAAEKTTPSLSSHFLTACC